MRRAPVAKNTDIARVVVTDKVRETKGRMSAKRVRRRSPARRVTRAHLGTSGGSSRRSRERSVPSRAGINDGRLCGRQGTCWRSIGVCWRWSALVFPDSGSLHPFEGVIFVVSKTYWCSFVSRLFVV